MPGCLQPKVRHGNFLIYGVKSTIENSKKECECQNAKLVTIESKAKLYKVQDALLGNDSKHFYGIDDKFWTGGSIDLSSGHPYAIQWHGSPTIPFSDYEFQRFVSFLADHFETAIANLNKTISKDLLRDGSSQDYIYYLGLHHPSKYPVENTAHISMLLMILNYGEILNKDTSKFFVVCEKNSEK